MANGSRPSSRWPGRRKHGYRWRPRWPDTWRHRPEGRRFPSAFRSWPLIIPFAFLELRPEATKALLKRSQDWLLGHAFQLMAGIALALGAYLTISGLVRLS